MSLNQPINEDLQSLSIAFQQCLAQTFVLWDGLKDIAISSDVAHCPLTQPGATQAEDVATGSRKKRNTYYSTHPLPHNELPPKVSGESSLPPSFPSSSSPAGFTDVSRKTSLNLVISEKCDIARMCDGEDLPVPKQSRPRLEKSVIEPYTIIFPLTWIL